MGLPIEFYVDFDHSSDELEVEADERLCELAKWHGEMSGASICIDKQAHGQSLQLYRARVSVFVRPKNIHAQHKGESMRIALGRALDAIERQIRKKHKQMGD